MADMERLARLCDEAEASLAEGNPEEALELAEEALTLAPKDGLALLLKAEASYAIEEDEDGDSALKAAIRAHPEDPGVLMRAAAVTLEAYGEDYEKVEDALDLLTRAEKLTKKVDDPLLPSAISQLMGRAFTLIDDLESSAQAFEKARSLAGEAADDELLVELAIAWFELCRFDDAKKLLKQVESRDPDHPDAAWYLGLVAEREGDAKAAEKLFARARKLDPDMFPEPVTLSEKEFDEALASALAKVPEPVRKALENVAICVEPLPAVEELKGPPALSPLSLGMFVPPENVEAGGGQIGYRGFTESAGATNVLPAKLTLYQKNIERYATSRDDVISEIEATLLHEIGHFVGWDEADLHDRGLH